MGDPGRRWLRLVGAVLLAATGCPGTPGPLASTEGSSIGRMCGEAGPEMLAAQAIASAYRLLAVREVQLVPTEQEGLFVAVYRLGPEDARPQELFAATVLEEPGCMAVVAQGDACDPLSFSPIYLPPFADGTVLVESAQYDAWDAVDEPVVVVALAAAAQSPEQGFTEAAARGRCIFRLERLPDGRLAPATLFAWTTSAFTVELARDGQQYTTEAASAVRATDGVAPRPLTIESQVVDVACGEVEDRRATCVEQCVARSPADADDAAPDALGTCETECAAVEPTPGRWCAAVVDRVTEWLAGSLDSRDRPRFEPTGQEEARSILDADCVLASDGSLVERIESCRRQPASGEPGADEPSTADASAPEASAEAGSDEVGLPQGAPGSGSSGSK